MNNSPYFTGKRKFGSSGQLITDFQNNDVTNINHLYTNNITNTSNITSDEVNVTTLVDAADVQTAALSVAGATTLSGSTSAQAVTSTALTVSGATNLNGSTTTQALSSTSFNVSGASTFTDLSAIDIDTSTATLQAQPSAPPALSLKGRLWVLNSNPTQLMFTDSLGSTINLSNSASSVNFPTGEHEITTSGTHLVAIPFPLPKGIKVIFCGAGGGGGGGGTQYDAGGGGGAGETVEVYIPQSMYSSLGIPSFGGSLWFSIGAFGTAGTGSGNGNSGGSSVLRANNAAGTVIATCGGGLGGFQGNNGARGGEGAATFVPFYTGIIGQHYPGENGQSGKDQTGSDNDAYEPGGHGGKSQLGRGAAGATLGTAAAFPGNPFGALRGGGGGGAMNNGSLERVASHGADGYARIFFY